MRTSRAVFAAKFVNFDRSGPGNTENVQIDVQKWNEITATEGVQRKDSQVGSEGKMMEDCAGLRAFMMPWRHDEVALRGFTVQSFGFVHFGCWDSA
ncbi:unnamed protein product [Cladocopium goreaui]|uniref:Uncharacterized protein n=1 Tax=Cladocopium goreaui TaxID=2562237 RepID=A0A9P1CGG0_9DINO|nr:unnamed protein product [Cladocopium goreaui]